MSAPGLKITNFHYAQTTFQPPSGFVEFPKWIHMPGYPSQIVETAQEEEVLRARPPIAKDEIKPQAPIIPAAPVSPIAPTKVLTGANDEREILLQIAAENKIKVDARWKTDRIRATVERETASL